MDSAPYKVVAYEPGAATVRDRAGVRVGYVLAGWRDWYAFVSGPEGPGREVGHHRYRREAAEAVWRAHCAVVVPAARRKIRDTIEGAEA